MKKKAISILLSLCLTLSCATVGSVAVRAADAPEAAVSASASNLPSRIEDGNILHCFDWKYSDIMAELPNIAAAGFTSVQTSPAQTPTSTGSWYWLYQPRGFSVASNPAPLGSRSQLAALCSAADAYGIKIIVDVVANHLTDTTNLIEDGLSASQYWHNTSQISNYSDRNDVINGRVGMRDLNTSNTTVQTKVRNYLADLKSLGVDGIRWDAAKHIGLPSEGDNFWPNVLDSDMFNYGEIFGDPGGNSSTIINQYAAMMGVSDTGYSGEIMGHVRDNSVYTPSGKWTTMGVPAEKVVYFGESHDTFSNNTNDGGWTKYLTQNQVDRAYAVVAAKADSQALYFSRPSSTEKDSIIAGAKGSTHFTSPEVAQVNAFHNAMVGTDEAYTTGNNCFVVCREGGAVVVSPKGSNISVTVPNSNGMVPQGTYTDKISGSQWTVTATGMTGTIGSSGIAVFYDAPAVNPSVPVPSQTIYFDNSSYNWSNVYCYLYTSGGETAAAWPGLPMTAAGNNLYTLTVPAGFETSKVMFTESSNATTNRYPGASEPGMDMNGVSMIFGANHSWTVYSSQPTQATQPPTQATQPPTQATQPPTQATQPPVTEPTDRVLIGDVDGDGSVSIKDVTEIQLFLAEFKELTDDALAAADVNQDDRVNVKDVTALQRYLADLSGSDCHAGEYIYAGGEPVTEATASVETRTILFTDTQNWGAVNVHYWGGSSETQWPGIAMTPADTNEFNQAQFSANIPVNTTGLVFNGGGKQTVNITCDAAVVGWYPLDSTDGQGHYEVGTWTGGSEPVTEPTNPPEPVQTRTILFTDTKNWGAVNVHYWGGSSETQWPGIAMTPAGTNEFDQAQFSANIPVNTTGLVFNGGGKQTVNITCDAAVVGWYPLDSTDGQGHYEVGTWTGGSEPVTEPTNPPEPDQTRTILFTDTQNWGAVNVHYWGGSSETQWPGIAMTPAGYNEFDQAQFSANIPVNTTGLVFNGGGKQTVNVTCDAAVVGWYPLDSTDGQGHYEVGTWTGGTSGGNTGSTTKTVLFSSNKGWTTVYIHYWGGSASSDWPGVAMTSIGNNTYGEAQFSVEIPADTTGIIFHNNSGSQTVNILYDNTATGYYLTTETDGKWNAAFWQ